MSQDHVIIKVKYMVAACVTRAKEHLARLPINEEGSGRGQRCQAGHKHRGDGPGQETGLPTGGEETDQVKYTRLLGDQSSY